MNRSARSHRSTKIPNVKLRPAVRGSEQSNDIASTQQQKRRRRFQNEVRDDREADEHFRQLRDTGVDHGAHQDSDFIGTSARPLKGAVISMTGLGDAKTALTQFAKELGARVEGNLTEDVTHVIADRPGSEKYRFALDLGMHIVKPDWILELRGKWLQGEDVDAEALEHEFSLRALEKTTVCFAGLPGEERRRLAGLAKELGANTSDELRFDGTISHLVSGTSDPEASSSIRYILHFIDRARQGRSGKREEAAAQISVVRPEWLHDCKQAGGCLSESTYSVFSRLPDESVRKQLIARATRKIESPFVKRSKPLAFQSPFTTANKNPLTLIDPEAGPKRSSMQSYPITDEKDRDGQDGEEEEEELITLGSRQRAAAAADKSFDSILSQLRSTTAANSPKLASAGPSSRPPALPPSISSTQRNGLLGMSRAASFSPATSNTTTSAALAKRKSSGGLVFLPSLPVDSAHTNSTPCFVGCSFKIQVADQRRSKVLRGVLEGQAASVLDHDDPAAAHYVVVDSRELQPARDKGSDAIPVTHFWIEYCLHHERFVDPSLYFASAPGLARMPIPDGDKLRVLLLGFEQDSPESYHARKLVDEIGGGVADQLKGEALSHIVCATRESYESRRAQRARSRGIPVGGLELLINARKTGRLLPPAGLVAASESNISGSGSAAEMSRGSSSHSRPDDALPLSGCIVSRSKMLSAQNAILERKVLQLGATFQALASDATTHLLHQGSGLPRECKEVSRDLFLVHPSWLDKCREEGLRVDESLFPSSLNPSKSLATILSNSDGSSSGNFLSQASQNPHGLPPFQMQTKMQLQTQVQSQTQAALVAAAKPWHRSVSANAAEAEKHLFNEAEMEDVARTKKKARRRSESLEPPTVMLEDVGEDGDITLQDSEHGRDPSEDAVAAPSSQTLIEEQEEEEKEKQQRVSPPLIAKLREASDQTASADEVMALLRSRALAQGSKKKARLPPRFRKQRSDDFRSSSRSPAPSLMGSEAGMMAPEQVLELQAKRDAERAAEAAAHGYSLGLEKDIQLPFSSQNSNQFDASIRIVYDDPAARRERNRLMKILARPKATPTPPPQEEERPKRSDGMDAVQDISVSPPPNFPTSDIQNGETEDTFGAGRFRHWESRKSESPNKRPVVRRQPLARR